MERSLYIDGVEVDASDLTNTEDTKVNEILLTRRVTAHYGVIDGLGCSNSGNRISIDTGRVLFANGEIAVLDSPIVGISGAAFEGGVSTFVGVRLGEVTSNPKPHEVDPTLFDTRAEPKLNAELFVASDNSAAARALALKAAIDAELNDGNFVLLAEFSGVGNGLSQLPTQVTPKPRSKGGSDPFRTNSKTQNQQNGILSVYLDQSADAYPIESAEDHFHRSLIGSGVPNPANAHGLTLTDIGGDQVLDQVITKHQKEYHANGIVGMAPPPNGSNGDFTDVLFSSGSFAWGIDQASGAVLVHDLLSVADGAPEDEVLVIAGKELKKGQSNTIPDGVIAPRISFASKDPGLYYIVARWGSNEPGGHPVFLAMKKADLDILCVNSGGTRGWLNNAVDTDNEKKFYVIGLVQWNGSSAFTNLDSNNSIRIPDGSPTGDLIYKKTGSLPPNHPFLIPPGMKCLDLRRFGNITNEEVQKRTLRVDRLTERVITETDFIAHSGQIIVSGSVTNVGGGLHAVAANTGDTTLKHLTDGDAFSLFGHRPFIGTAQHGLAQHSPALDVNGAPVDEDAANSGFQSSRDKWRQDNLTMTLMKWSDLNNVAAAERAMGDAAAVSSGDPFLQGSGSYIFYRSGVIKNFGAHIHSRPAGASNGLTISLKIRPIGSAVGGLGVQSTVPNCVVFASPASVTQFDVLGFTGGSPTKNVSCINVIDAITITAQIAAPVLIQMTHRITGGGTWVDLNVTAEYHYTS